MESVSNARVTRTLTLFVLLFVAYFVITEFDGLLRLAQWLINGIAAAPAALQALFLQYQTLPFQQIAPSLLIGGAFGALSTAYVLRQRWPLLTAALIGAVIGALGSQILTAATGHCTYAPQAAPVEAALGVGLTIASSTAVLLPLWLLLRRRPRTVGSMGHFRSGWAGYLLLAPTIASLLLFLYYPGVQVFNLSLTAKRFPLPQERFVCLGNYVTLANDPAYQSSFVITAFITAAITLLSLSAALGIALLAVQKIRGALIYRSLLIWPFALSPIVTGVIFLALFREGKAGLINFALSQFFGTTVNWLRDPALARWVIVLASVWNVLGFNILFYIAGLHNIPADVLEAAQIDGANRVQRFWRITFPLLTPFTFFLLVTNVSYAFYGIYGAVDALTHGGPPVGPAGQFGGATSVLIFKLYQDAFNPGSPVGLAASQAIILFFLVAGLTLLQFRTVETRVEYLE